jgi:hypothetical protein
MQKKAKHITLTEISIIARNRTQFITDINHSILMASGTPYINDPTNENSYYLRLNRHDCKCEHIYRTVEEIPLSSLFCKHGNQIIRYTDEEILN